MNTKKAGLCGVQSQLRRRVLVAALVLGGFAGAGVPDARAQANFQVIQPPATATLNSGAPLTALRLNPSTLAQIRSLPPSSNVQLGSGKIVKAGQVQALSQALQGIAGKTSRLRAVDLALSRPSGPAKVVLNGGAAQMPQIRSMPPSTVVQLSNGTKVTVGDIAKLEKFADATGLRAKLAARGGSAGASGPRLYAGRPAMKVTSRNDVLRMDMPDDTIVEGPNGARAPLGELKALLGGKPAVPGALQPIR